MIHSLLKKIHFQNDLTQSRWTAFIGDRMAIWAITLIVIVTLFSATANLWSNSKPLMMSYEGKVYFPVFKTYHPTEFGITNVFRTNYKTLDIEDKGWALWPPNRWDPFETNANVEYYPAPPSTVNWFGTDDRGRDVFARLLYGYRYSMTYAVAAWFLSTLLGVFFGAMMGFAGGKVDFFGQRLVEVWSSVPYLFLLIILISIFQPSLGILLVLTTLFSWMLMCQYIRAEFLKNRKKDFVDSAWAIGQNKFYIIVRHILPNSLVPVITFSPFLVASHISGLAGLDYLGFGLPPPTPSWGELLRQAQRYFTVAWWLALFPSLALFATLTLLSMIGQAVRAAFDPRKSRV
jgi:microcin C transport system permease protein